jgi:hypothetical protein
MKRFIIALFLLATPALAADKGQGRTRVIDFEDQLVEGVNRQPLDSLSQLSDEKKRRKYHLYKKRAGFRDQMAQTLDELRDLQ